MRHSFVIKLTQVVLLLACRLAAATGRSADKPNILVIRGDDIGWFNISAYNHGMMGYQRWRAERMFALAPAQAFVAKWLQSFKEYPPRQKPGSFSLQNAMDEIASGSPH